MYLSRTSRAILTAAILVVLAVVALVPQAIAAKDHVVRMENGDTLTGEVKSLERGRLTFKTAATDKIMIEWARVDSLWSGEQFQVELSGGRKLFGSLSTPRKTRLLVHGPTDSLVVNFLNVVAITPIKGSFWGKIDGSVSFGFSYTQANNLIQYTFGADINYRTEKWKVGMDASSIVSAQDSVETTQRHDFTTSLNRYLKKKKSLIGEIQFQSNDELGIDLRVLTSGAGGISFIQNNSLLFGALAGLSLNSERALGTTEFTQNLEALLGLSFQSFTYQHPERDITMTLSVFPSLTDSGRVRLDGNAKVSWEIFTDFYLALTVRESYDTKPPAESSSKNDLTLSTSIGYSF